MFIPFRLVTDSEMRVVGWSSQTMLSNSFLMFLSRRMPTQPHSDDLAVFAAGLSRSQVTNLT